MNSKKIAFSFIALGFSCLIVGLLFGYTGSLQYLFPGLFKDQLSFQKTRPLHVFLVTQWIWSAAIGAVYYFLPQVANRKLYSEKAAFVHFLLQLFVICIAVFNFFNGSFTGREYLEFPLWLCFVLIAGWILALINFIGTARPNYAKAPVYIWSWTTGLVFFIITISEASLWNFDHFNGNVIRDITVQWKALGSMVGAWNMLIYGSAIYVMSKAGGKEDIAHSKMAFFFYFLSLTNLMFNWGHHTYIVPASPTIRNVSYIISMTELIIFFDLILEWRKSFRKDHGTRHFSYKFLTTADNWIILNLGLALAISVPYINQYTHGTHITVAHAMGTTIGINTPLLLAIISFIYIKENKKQISWAYKNIKPVLWVFNISLLVFWLSLIAGGISRSQSILANKPFYELMQKLQPIFQVFSLSGLMLVAALIFLAQPLLAYFIKQLTARKEVVDIPNLAIEVNTLLTEDIEA
jgi:nitric oxide reductase subunit B